MHGERCSGVQCGLGWDQHRRWPHHRQTDAQLRRSVKLAESWKPGGGGGTTLTEDIAFGDQKRVGQGHLICIVFEKETEQSTNSGFLFPDFCVYCFTEVFTSAEVQPSKSQGGRVSMGPTAPWHPVAKGGQNALHALGSEGHSMLGG